MQLDYKTAVELECAGKLVAVHVKYGNLKMAQHELNRLYGRLLLLYEGLG